MIRHIASSFSARFAVMALTLAIVAMNSRVLGGSGQGLASLIQLGILLMVSVSSYIGGAAVVYLIPRTGARPLLLPAYLMAAAVALGFFPLLKWLELLDSWLIIHVCALGWMQSLFTFHLQLLIGRERIHPYNLITTAQSATLALALVIFYFAAGERTIQSYLGALYLSFGTTLLISILAGRKWLKPKPTVSFSEALKALWRYGKYGQTGNIFQLLTYRSPLYFLEKTMESGLAAAGVFSIGFYAAEAVWSVGKSISLVQHARIANSNDHVSNKQLTIGLLIFSVALSAVITAGVLVIPETVFLVIFGDDMQGIARVLLCLSPGIVANAGSVIIAHHFSGTGRHRINTLGSAAGLGVLLIAIFPAIDGYGTYGAALAAALGYIIQFGVLFWSFTNVETISKEDWLRGFRALRPNKGTT